MTDLAPVILTTTVQHPIKRGPAYTVLATHTLRMGPLIIRGARLVEHPDGAKRVLLPGHGQGSRVTITDPRIREELLAASLAAVAGMMIPF